MDKYITNLKKKAAERAAEEQEQIHRHVFSTTKLLLRNNPTFKDTRDMFIILASLVAFMNGDLACAASDKLEETMQDRSHDIFRVIQKNFERAEET